MRVQTQNDNLLGALGAPTPIEGSAKAGSSDFPNHFRAATGQQTPAAKVQAEFGKQTVAQQLLSPSETLLQTKTTPTQPLFNVSPKEAIIAATALPETDITVVGENILVDPIADPLLSELDTAAVVLSPLAEQNGLPVIAPTSDAAEITNPEQFQDHAASQLIKPLDASTSATLLETLPQNDTAETTDAIAKKAIATPMSAPIADPAEPSSLSKKLRPIEQGSLPPQPAADPLQAELVLPAIPLVQTTAPVTPQLTSNSTPITSRPTALNSPATGAKLDATTRPGSPTKVAQPSIAQPTNAAAATTANPIAELVDTPLNTPVITTTQNDQTIAVTETNNAFQTVKSTEINLSQIFSPELTVSTLAPTATASVGTIATTTTSANAAQMAPPPPLDMSQSNWAETLISSIERPEGTGDADTLTLNLTPERLGNMQIRLEQRDGLTHVHIVTSSPEAARIVNEAQHRLADLMTRAGLEMGNQSTSSDLPQNTEQNGNGRGQGTAKDPNAPTLQQGELGSSDTLSEMTPSSTATRPTHAVDLLA